MNKAELIQRIETDWMRLQASLDGLSEGQLHTPGVVGEWSIKDILAHITAWQTRLIAAMFKAEKGLIPDTTGADATVDKLNAQWYREMKDRPFDQVWDDLDASYHQILGRLENWSEADLFEPKRFKWMKGEPFERYLAGDSYEHYVEHAEHIKAWRKKINA
ncbi:MAG TPA: ClbS/DfsB family four-helix bundle protein [Anaerolineae bacterium]|nr:ClbS/DfsB family four-helix bundle protein [Anaerolineae bacterium]